MVAVLLVFLAAVEASVEWQTVDHSFQGRDPIGTAVSCGVSKEIRATEVAQRCPLSLSHLSAPRSLLPLVQACSV